MNLIRCSQGHFYDADKDPVCPHCGAQGRISPDNTASSAFRRDSSNDETVSSVTWNQNQPPVMPGSDVRNFDETVSVLNRPREDAEKGAKPVVGWLVCTQGGNFGKDYRLIAGHNFIGRSSDMNVCLDGDKGVSREKHAIVTYDPVQNQFFIQPGTSRELCYLNGSVVLQFQTLKANDVLKLGNSQLLFIPCCTEQFIWKVDEEEGKQND